MTSVPAYFMGTFKAEEIVNLDANALTAFPARLLQGTTTSGIVPLRLIRPRAPDVGGPATQPTPRDAAGRRRLGASIHARDLRLPVDRRPHPDRPVQASRVDGGGYPARIRRHLAAEEQGFPHHPVGAEGQLRRPHAGPRHGRRAPARRADRRQALHDDPGNLRRIHRGRRAGDHRASADRIGERADRHHRHHAGARRAAARPPELADEEDRLGPAHPGRVLDHQRRRGHRPLGQLPPADLHRRGHLVDREISRRRHRSRTSATSSSCSAGTRSASAPGPRRT